MNDIIKILVIEREPVVSRQLKKSLNREQHIVFGVSSVMGAVERLKSIFFDIVVVDVYQDWNDQEDFFLLRSITWMAPKTKIILVAPEDKQNPARNVEGLKIFDFIHKHKKFKNLIASINHLKRCLLMPASFFFLFSLCILSFPVHLVAAPSTLPPIDSGAATSSTSTSGSSALTSGSASTSGSDASASAAVLPGAVPSGTPAFDALPSTVTSVIFKKAMSDLQANNLKAARKGFEELIFNHPEAPEVVDSYIYLGKVYENLNLPYEATAVYHQFTQEYPDHQSAPEILMRQGEIAFQLGEIKKAKGIFKHILFQYPNTSLAPSAAFRLGDSLYELEDTTTARLYYDEGMEHSPQFLDDHPQTAFNIGGLALQDKRFDRALNIFLALEKNYPQLELTSKAVTFCGDIYAEQEKIPEAVLAYQRVIDNYPHSIGAQVSQIRMADLGVEHPDVVIENPASPLDAFRNPIQAYQELLKKKTTDLVLAHLAEYKLGLAFQKKGDHGAAVAAFRSLLAKGPEERIYQNGLYALKQELTNELDQYFRKEEYMAVIKSYEANRDLLDPFWHEEKTPLPYFNVARSYQTMSFYPPAMRLYQEALGFGAQDTLHSQIHFHLGQIFFKTGEYQKALDTLKEVAQKSKTPGLAFAALSLMADAYREAKDYTKALDYYQASLAMQPLQQGQEREQLFKAGRCYEKIGKIPEAIQSFAKAADRAQKEKEKEKDKDSRYLAEIYLHLADCQYKIGEYSEALKSYQHVQNSSPLKEDLDWVLFQIGNCSLKTSEPKAALDAFQELKASNQDSIWPIVAGLKESEARIQGAEVTEQ
ncbi:MAG: tetratricopeptide repeat protein [bacterium]